MSLVDDARKLAEDEPIETDRGGRGECHYCGGGNYEGGYLNGSRTLDPALHKPDCPWLSTPRIVAALEAAEEVISDWEETRDGAPDYGSMSALRMALRGQA